ncbi:hypothetical protein UFOVP235_37 [uncultured Caudovirales phage]|uniref:Uncharacterized protein n=1 Tax=uncultured Caudovirales phage TaxID=2100421 RepID=A0A6J7WQJ5_9CAUD|nr:hypothetical protein UFOVP235_37 [uncultured Caudovirales phage]
MERDHRQIATTKKKLAMIEHDLARVSDRILEIDMGDNCYEDELKRAFTKKRGLLKEKLQLEIQLIEMRHEVSLED